MHLCVVTPTAIVVDEDVLDVYAPGAVGELGVLPDHITFLGVLESGEIRYRGAKGAGSLVMSGGVVEVVNDVVTILADDALAPRNVDVEVARQDLAEAEGLLATGDPMSPEHEAALGLRRWAQVRIAAAERPPGASH